jgi:carboxyl-terminal processing protease
MLPEDPEIIEPSPTAPGYVAGPAPVPVGRGPRRLGRLAIGVAIVLVALIGGSGLFMSGYLLGMRQAAQPGTSAADSAAFQPFWDAYHNISAHFALGPVDQKTIVEGAIKGMVDSLGDPYSAYLSPTDFQNTLQDISGTFEGIGAEVGTVDASGKTSTCTTFGANCRLEIAQPLPGSPAEKAGLQPGDVVTKIDGTTVDGLTPDQTTSRIRGPAGTSVTLTIVRGSAAPFDVTIVRAKITRQEVVTKDLANGSVGYVQLTGFSETGADAAVAAIKADVQKGQKKLILDLRGNPGGFIDAAQRLASAFVASGPVFWQQDASGNQSPTNAIPGGPATDPSIRVVVLVDGGTASAAEIVTGALKDTGRATIVGQKTFGKGTVQTWYELGTNGDEGGIKLTIAKWLTPNKTWIHKIGITPDVVVDVPSNLPAGSDPILDKALAILAAPPTSPAPSPGASAPASPPAPGASGAPAASPASSSVQSFLVGWVDVE